ncbi:hypothetical protein AHAS_Ahas14G0066000 [Arachis hypogaea]
MEGEQPDRVRAAGMGSGQDVDEICGLRIVPGNVAQEAELPRLVGRMGRNGEALNDAGEGGRWQQDREKRTNLIQEQHTCESQDRIRLLEDEGYGNLNGSLMGCTGAEENQHSGGVIGLGPEEGEIAMESEERVNGREQEEQHVICTQSGTERGSAMDGGTDVQNENQRPSWEEEMAENKEAWKLAVESGVQCSDEDDIMTILQEQNEAIALKRKQAKQKEKARRSRPKNRTQVCNKFVI